MTVQIGEFTRDRVEELCDAIHSGILMPTYHLSEYNLFSRDQLFKVYKRALIDKSDHGALYVHITGSADESAWALLNNAEYDSSIFGFKVNVLDTVTVSAGFSHGTALLFQQIVRHASEHGVKYISLSLNTNDPSSPQILNCAIRSGFYYINTLITFGFTRQNFDQLDLNFEWDKEVSVRLSKPEDFEPLLKIAVSSYKIDRYHLDPYLPKDKCDTLYAESLRNSFFHGFVDRIFVAEYRGEPIGYFSGRTKYMEDLGVKLGTFVISSVSPNHRGLGAFKAMNRHLIQSLNADSAVSESGTYINNYPVHSVYIRSKMRLMRGSLQMGYYNQSLGE